MHNRIAHIRRLSQTRTRARTNRAGRSVDVDSRSSRGGIRFRTVQDGQCSPTLLRLCRCSGRSARRPGVHLGERQRREAGLSDQSRKFVGGCSSVVEVEAGGAVEGFFGGAGGEAGGQELVLIAVLAG